MAYNKGKTPIELIKEKVTCVQAAQALGLKIKRSGDRCKSWRPGATNESSLMIEDSHACDFGTMKTHDVIDIWTGFRNISVGEAIKELCETFCINLPKNYKPKTIDSQQKLLVDAVTLYHKSMTKEQRKYYYKRGLTDETIEKFKLGYGNNIKLNESHGYSPDQVKESGVLDAYKRFTIPYLHNGIPTYLITREDEKSSAKYKKLKKSEWNENAVFGYDSIKNRDTVYVAEGIFDALVLLQEGYACISPITGRFSGAQLNTVKHILRNKEVIICFDYDPKSKAGAEFTWDLADKLIKIGIDVKLIFIPGDETKIDLNDLYNTEEKLEILKTAKSAIEHKINLAKTLKEAENIIEIIASTMNNANASIYLKKLSRVGIPDCSAIWVKETYKIKQAYSEMRLIKKVLDENKIINIPKLGFYIFNEINTLWEKEDEEFISKMIIHEYPKDMTGSKVRSATHLMKVMAAEKGIEFNQNKDWFSVKNGMANIHTGEFRERVEEDFTTLTTNYNYNKDASTTEVETFLSEIADEDQQRIRLLKQIMGYCLIKECKYHKAFILYGKGRNGKSVFLQMIEKMVGTKNVSHIPIHGLDDHFKVIHMKDKLVNLSEEMNADNGEGTDVFKKAVAGDTVSGCLKGKDHIDFVPFAKLIFATNKIMTSKDTSEGYLDRLVFIDFPCKYVSEPTKDFHRKKEENYFEDKLLPNIPGAFLVAIEGLHDLIKEGKFVETEESAMHTEDVKRVSNAVYAFANDKKLNGTTYTMDDLYIKFQQWAQETGSGKFSKRRFVSEVKETLNLTSAGSYAPNTWKITW